MQAYSGCTERWKHTICVPKSNIHQKIATNIRELRKKKQIAQEKLVLEANLNRAYISCIECEERKPSIDTLAKFAKVPDV